MKLYYENLPVLHDSNDIGDFYNIEDKFVSRSHNCFRSGGQCFKMIVHQFAQVELLLNETMYIVVMLNLSGYILENQNM